jgi:CTP:molybdopterin cytidylyltransferase MocA
VIAVVVLAAGEASRFGAPKQRLLLPDVLRRARRATIDEVVVVEGAHPLGEAAAGARVVHCPDWHSGPGASLRCGLEALGDGVEAAIVILADGPDLAPTAIDRVVESWRALGGEVVAASYGGRRSHPLLVARAAWPSIPHEGLRHAPARLVACDDLGPPGDVDRPEDLPERLHQGWRSRL